MTHPDTLTIPRAVVEQAKQLALTLRNDGAEQFYGYEIASCIEDLVAALAALQPQPSDQDPNAPWLSSAHILCTEHGIPQGEITERIDALRDKLSSPPSTEVLQAEIERLKLHIKHIGNDALRDENHALRSAITKLHAAKGRYHTQIAACDLFDVAGLKNERPVK